MVPFSFGIRMAALGSRKELIDLETWLNTNLSTYEDTFFEVQYLDLLRLSFLWYFEIKNMHVAKACIRKWFNIYTDKTINTSRSALSS